MTFLSIEYLCVFQGQSSKHFSVDKYGKFKEIDIVAEYHFRLAILWPFFASCLELKCFALLLQCVM